MARHRTPVEQRFHAEAWRRSGTTLTAYAQHVGVSQQTLARWVKQHPVEGLQPFVDVTPKDGMLPGLQGSIAGCEVRLDALPPPEWFADVLTRAGAGR